MFVFWNRKPTLYLKKTIFSGWYLLIPFANQASLDIVPGKTQQWDWELTILRTGKNSHLFIYRESTVTSIMNLLPFSRFLEKLLMKHNVDSQATNRRFSHKYMMQRDEITPYLVLIFAKNNRNTKNLKRCRMFCII